MAGKIKVPSELVPSQSNKIMLRSKYVYDDVKGHTQEEINQALEEQIESKVIEAGGVNWDTVPTAGSNNAVKSKDIKAALEKVTGYFVLDSNILESTVAKTVTVADFPALAVGGSIKIKMLTKNTATNPTLRIGANNAPAYPLYYNNERASADNSWEEDEVISVYFDGTNYQASNAQGGGGKAKKIKYDNSASGFAATDVQDALDEVKRVSIGSKPLSIQEYTGTTSLGLVSQRQINADGTITAATGSTRNNYLVRWFKGICTKDDYIEFEGTPNSGRTVRIGFVEDNPDEMTDEELLATVVDDVSELYITANTTGKIRVKVPYDGYLIYFLVAGSGVWQGPTWTIWRSNIVYDVKNNLEETVPGNPLDAVQGALLYSKIEKTTQFVNTGYYAIANKGIDATNTIVNVSSDFNIGYIPVKKNKIFKFHYTQSDALNCVLQVAMTSEVPAVNVIVTDLITDQKEEGLVTYTIPYDGYLVFRYRINSGYMTLFEVLKESVLTEYEDYYEDTNVVHIYSGKIISVDESNLGAEISVDSSWGWGSSTYLYVKGCKYVKFSLFASGRGQLMNKGGVFYDADKQPLSVGAVGIIVPHTSGITGHDVDTIIEVPADAVYFRFTTFTADTVENAVKISTYKYKANTSFDDRKEAIDYILAQAKYVDAVNSVAGTDYVNKESLTLLHFTDIHAETRAAECIKEVIDALGDKLDDVLCTGDVVYANYKSSSTENSAAISEAAPYGYKWWQESGLAEKSLFTIGNHEGNQRSSTSQYHETNPVNDWDYIGKQIECETFIEPYAEGLGITRPDGADDAESPDYKAMYWYKDYAEQKIRLIGIDGIHHYDNVRYTTMEQEDWLTATLAATPSDYSVIFACHFGLDDFAGDNAKWDDETHKWICNENEGGGRVMVDGDNVTKFHDVKSTAYTCNAQMALRVKYIPDGDSYGQRRTTDENPIGDIIQSWIDGGGKCVAWIAGHTHIDYMFYPTKYPSILNIVNNCARSGFETNMSYRPANAKTGTFEDYCANIYVFDTQNGVIKIIRVGKSMDKYLVKKDYLCYDYINKKVISEG